MLAIYAIVVVILLFAVTIFVHELGHFLAARRLGLVVDVFSIGFGPALWKKKINGIMYKIGCLPFGGYVALPQLDPGADKRDEEGNPRVLPRVEPWKKIIVSIAGATGNILFAILLAYFVYWIGKPSAPHERDCIVGYVDAESAAYEAGLRVGDDIVIANDQPVENWDDLIMACALADRVKLGIMTSDGESRTAEVPTEKNWMGVQTILGLGWVNYCSVASVVPGSSAEKAGLEPGDIVRTLDGVKLYSREHLIDLVDERRNEPVPAEVERNGELITVMVTPAYDEEIDRALIGIMFNTMDIDYDATVHPTPSSQIKQHATVIVRFLRALVTPREAKAASRAVGGPIAILFMFWLTVKKSIMVAIWFTGLLNVNLAILNLLPIPVLDGGHVIFALWEAITRKPLSERVINATVNVFAVILISLFVLLSLRDVKRWVVPLLGWGGEEPVAEETVPDAPAE